MRRWLAATVSVVVVACGGGPTPEPVTPPARGAASSPFRVDHVPEGYRIAALGRGSSVPVWGSDELGTTEPVTVLAPEGDELTEEELLLVSITGYEGHQGVGFRPNAGMYPCAGDRRATEVEGRSAIFTMGDDAGCSTFPPWSELIVDRGDDLAVRVRAVGWSLDQLAEVERGVVPGPNREEAPSVTPPDGWSVIGSIDADLALAVGGPALDQERRPTPNEAFAPESAHVLGWRQGARQLAVLTLPGGGVDGLVAFSHGTGWNLSVEARRDGEVVLSQPGMARVLFREAPWGDLLVVGSYGTPEPLSLLRAVADSVVPVDGPSWEAFLVEATGGPGLDPDPGFSEVARGHQGGQDWLLQANPSGIDVCIKLTNQRRACADDGQMGSAGWFSRESRPEAGKPGFVLLVVDGNDREVIVTSGAEVVRSPLTPMPDGRQSVAVVFLDEPGSVGDCGDRPVPPTLHVLRVDVVAADGSTRCLRF